MQKTWKRRLYVSSIFYFGLLAILITLEILIKLNIINLLPALMEIDPSQNVTFNASVSVCDTSPVPAFCEIFLQTDLGGYLQFALVYVQLMVIVGLCMDNGKSMITKFFNTKLMQFLGRISMALYLIHEPIIFYIRLCFYGVWNWESEFGPQPPPPSPAWTIPIHMGISILLASFLTIFIEEPGRKMLKSWKQKRNETKEEVHRP